MLKIIGSPNLHRIVVLNSKGGSGKTTLAFNLAGYLASTGRRVALIDLDPQGSSMRWLQNRRPELREIHGVKAPENPTAPEDRVIALPADIDHVVIDSPAGVPGPALSRYTAGAHAILVPVMPSDIDIHAASRLIGELLLEARVSRANKRLGVVANRVKERTVAYRQLMSFLERLSIAVVGVLRDSQHYVSAARDGLCIHEMPKSSVKGDLEQWQRLTEWLEQRLATPLTERDWRAPTSSVEPAVVLPIEAQPLSKRSLLLRALPAAAVLATVALVISYLWSPTRASVEMPATPAAELVVDTPVIEPTLLGAEPAAEDSLVSGAETSDGSDSWGEASEAAGAELTAAEQLRQRWQLTGVAGLSDDRVALLSDRLDGAKLQITTDSFVDGWSVVEAGRDYVVLALEDEHVRLEFDEPGAP